MKLGAHQSIAGGYGQALDRIRNIGGNCLQIFSNSPRGWNPDLVGIDEVQKTEFVNKKNQLKIDPVYFHASYLINLANEEKIGHLSKLSLIAELNAASRLDIKGSIIHLGSFKNNEKKLSILVTHIREILERTPDNTLFIIENAGNNKIGKDLNEIAEIVKRVDSPRVRVCLDTCHLYSAGYDLSSREKLEKFLNLFDTLIGLDKLELFHANDSRDPFNSGRDKHANLGQGTIPLETFRLLLTDPRTKQLPYIIETPGFTDQGPDKQNLDILKKLT